MVHPYSKRVKHVANGRILLLTVRRRIAGAIPSAGNRRLTDAALNPPSTIKTKHKLKYPANEGITPGGVWPLNSEIFR